MNDVEPEGLESGEDEPEEPGVRVRMKMTKKQLKLSRTAANGGTGWLLGQGLPCCCSLILERRSRLVNE